MKIKLHIILCLFLLSGISYSQQDSVFIQKKNYNEKDSLVWVTDTAYFPSPIQRNILLGTCIVPWTSNQMGAKNKGLDFISVNKSECKSHGEEVYTLNDKINSITKTDSTLSIDFNLYSNCCYDFLCDISVDTNGYLNLIYKGYGNYCSCNCCFGLIYEMEIFDIENFSKIKGVLLNGKKESFLEIE